MKGIDIVVPISGWSSWYSTGGIITANGSKVNIPLIFENQDLGMGGPIEYEVVFWEDGVQKTMKDITLKMKNYPFLLVEVTVYPIYLFV